MNYSTVKLVAATTPRVEGIATAEEFVAYSARVSNPTNQMNSETAPKLLRYLIKNKHWSPFEMVSVVMEINSTRDIARQILRHRSFSYQEFSQRYANASQLGFVTREARLQDDKNRQASNPTEDRELMREWEAKQVFLLRHVKDTYDWALSNKIAKENARCVLPEGMTMSRMYMSGSLRSWIHYCQIRTEKATQKEHREVADLAVLALEEEFPSLIGLFNAVQEV